MKQNNIMHMYQMGSFCPFSRHKWDFPINSLLEEQANDPAIKLVRDELHRVKVKRGLIAAIAKGTDFTREFGLTNKYIAIAPEIINDQPSLHILYCFEGIANKGCIVTLVILEEKTKLIDSLFQYIGTLDVSLEALDKIRDLDELDARNSSWAVAAMRDGVDPLEVARLSGFKNIEDPVFFPLFELVFPDQAKQIVANRLELEHLDRARWLGHDERSE